MEVMTTVDRGRIEQLAARDEFFWLDLRRDDHEVIEEVGSILGLHPAAMEDTREWGQLPRLDVYDEHLLVIFASARRHDDHVEPVEVHVYVSGHWVVTARRCPTALDGLHEWLDSNELETEDRIVYLILDALTDAWDPVIDRVDHRVDEIEREVLTERPRHDQLKTIYRLKQEVVELTRRANPQRASFPHVIEAIDDLPGFDHGPREWLKDVDAHLDAIRSDLSRLNADLAALTDTFFNANAYRLNRLATIITVGSVFFLCWTLITGFFGQNFKWLTDNIESKGAFLAFGVGGLVVPTIVLAAIFFRRRRDLS